MIYKKLYAMINFVNFSNHHALLIATRVKKILNFMIFKVKIY